MERIVTVAAAQVGGIARDETRAQVVARLLALMRQAKAMGADLIVYPELSLTTFFPRWFFERQEDIDAWFERAMPSNETAPLFTESEALGMAFCLGYAELERRGDTTKRFNASVLVDRGKIVGKYRKVHLPGHAEHEPWRPFQHLEKRYFDVGDLGFPVHRMRGGLYGMCICNDRRWPESYRVMGLQGVEMVLIGYNTPVHNPAAPAHDLLSNFHNHLVMQSGAYQNGTFVVGVAKCGREEGCDMIGQSCIIAPSGEILAQCTTLADEICVARCDLDLTKSYKDTIFDFALHRQPQAYGLIVERKGAGPPLGTGGE